MVALRWSIVFVGLLGWGCYEDDEPETPPVDAGCVPGTAGCACAAGGGCAVGAACVEGTCDPICVPGNAGCPCADRACASADLVCIDDRCTIDRCPPGTLRCPCADDGRCGSGPMGEPLICITDRCLPDCVAGEPGCRCDDGRCAAGECISGLCVQRICAEPGRTGCVCDDGLCSGPEDACLDGLCVRVGCAPGSRGCLCDDGLCAAGDRCVDGVCRAPGCEAGSRGCACLDGQCLPDDLPLRCLDSVCVDGTGRRGGPCAAGDRCDPGLACIDGGCRACDPSIEGCPCSPEGACVGALVCVDGACSTPSLTCHTPCTGDVRIDDRFVRCPTSGLIGGCVLEGQVCTAGTCGAPGAPAPGCDDDLDCPDFQTCLDGLCRSTCADGAPCAAGQRCHRTVCRPECDPAADDCAAGWACANVDGSGGLCLPVRPATGSPQRQVDVTVRLDRLSLAMTSGRARGVFFVFNDSDLDRRFIVQKLRHRLIDEAGRVEEVVWPGDPDGCEGIECPLPWLHLGEQFEAAARQAVVVRIPAGESTPIEVAGADGRETSGWQGTLQISALDDAAAQATIELSYRETLDGRWTGTQYGFGRFGTRGLAAWSALPHPDGGDLSGTRDDTRAVQEVGNALIGAWSAVRRGRMAWSEFQAVLTATRTGSWRLPSVRDDCPSAPTGVPVCYPYEGGPFNGVSVYTPDVTRTPIPTGVVELPLALTLRVVPGCAGLACGEGGVDRPEVAEGRLIEGRVDSGEALHYPGDPAARLVLDRADGACNVSGANCLQFFDVEAMGEQPLFQVDIGGRLELAPAESCPPGFDEDRAPWLLAGFTRDAVLDPGLGRIRRSCRSPDLPYAEPDRQLFNRRLADANPVPDGRARSRTLRVIDGAFVDRETLFVIFEERFSASFLGGAEADAADLAGYGYLLLTRSHDDLALTDADDDGTPDAYQPATPGALRAAPPSDALAPACDRAVLDAADLGALGDDPVAALSVLLDGIRRDTPVPCLDDAADDPAACLDPGERVHAWCEDTGLFDGGFTDTPCPLGSRFDFFTVTGGLDPANHPCNAEGTCGATLTDWRRRAALAQDPVRWICADREALSCSADRVDLRRGKVFFPAGDAGPVFAPLDDAIADAFRYRVRFRARDGDGVGFVPQICDPAVDRTPYCYDPAAIEALRLRINCLLALWADDAAWDTLPAVERRRLADALTVQFSFGPFPRPIDLDPAALYDGFERLYAELLVMLGDEAFTRAFASRFDLAGARIGSFIGSAFEDDGIDLSGVAGLEMRLLYEAEQAHREVLDRFFALAPVIWRAIGYGQETRNFFTPDVVRAYVERVVKASTQRTRATSAIARRYQSFDRPDLATAVIEREFGAAYLESIILGRMMIGLLDQGAVAAEERADIERFVEEAQARYRSALLDMREVHRGVRSDLDRFGFPPDYVPFVAVDEGEDNAFEQAIARADQRLALAVRREETAIADDRSFESDGVEFQAELVQIRTTYESQLGALCGTFIGEDDVVRPATQAHADRLPGLRLVGDPCGFVGNGEISAALGAIEQRRLDLLQVIARMQAVRDEAQVERARVAAQCGLVAEAVDRVYRVGDERRSLARRIDDAERDIAQMRSALEVAGETLNGLATSGQCFTGADGLAPCLKITLIATAAYAVLATGLEVGVGLAQRRIDAAELDLDRLATAQAAWELGQQCRAAEIDSAARIDALLLQLTALNLEGLQAEYAIRLAIAELQGLGYRARQLQLEQTEAEGLAIDLAAARNDPTVRIYRNDAVINADVAFEAALREAWRATRVFEFYTSQSYAPRIDLFLTRLAARGDRNLENYLAELRDAFIEFEEQYGLPDVRVMVISLRDDIFRIPRIDVDGRALSAGERVDLMRTRLRDPRLLDPDGYLAVPFDIRSSAVSPVTRNHKIDRVEAEIVASDPGDAVARLYLVQDGTTVIEGLGGERQYFRLPPLTAVINPAFAGLPRPFDADVYANRRLRDRPLLATDWRLVINQRNEAVNQDLDLQSVDDIRLFVYYTDFTELR